MAVRRRSVTVAMVQIRIVRMLVTYRFVPVPMRMRFDHRSVMWMPMMIVMHMGMLMLQWFVGMFMIVPFREVKP